MSGPGEKMIVFIIGTAYYEIVGVLATQMMNLDTQMMIGVGCFAVAGGWLSRIQRRRTASQDFLSRSDSEPRHLVTGCAPLSTPPVVLPASTLLLAASCYVLC